jgi:hypothetical protein
MSISESFDEIIQNTHFRNWAPDWQILREVYETYPNAYAVLTPFAYSYLEELIRSMTSEYGIEVFDESGNPRKRKVGNGLLEMAIRENKDKSENLICILEDLRKYFVGSKGTDSGDNRNSVVHGFMHPRFWSNESFESLIYDIARLSKFSGF